jgi:hypothetical protein
MVDLAKHAFETATAINRFLAERAEDRIELDDPETAAREVLELEDEDGGWDKVPKVTVSRVR